MTNNISGYTGLFKQPIQLSATYGPTIYCVSDLNKEEAVFLLITPESFLDVYNLAKSMAIQNVKLIVPAFDVLFISTIFNLFMALKPIKPGIKIIYPESSTIETSPEFENGLELTDTYIHPIDNSIGISFVKDKYELSRTFYDIIIRDGEKVRYLAQYLNKEKAALLFDDETIDEIHIPYSSTLYGGLNYLELMQLNPEYRKKYVAHSFASITEYSYCKFTQKINIGRVIYNDIV